MSTIHIVTPEIAFDVLVPTVQVEQRMEEIAMETEGIVYTIR